MGYWFMVGECYTCRRIFAFNPVSVPSINVNGVKQPICKSCIDRGNRMRRERGMEPFQVPSDAYEVSEAEPSYPGK